ncbi:MarR family winged helix-turn-helix transcriptional regulator [Microbacterium sp. YJN-G]|uniref:MarR family winged helix-turn-helix transcriptional regulator n=1 Tax=Microbacterium sp. YJN-G TaxID=2763257 RepID=UPI0018788360|nr:MarR family transcriptional regulator [Microbacterium sp. YJN-G]
MPRHRDLTGPEDLTPEDLRPLVGGEGPTFASAMFAIGTWGASTAFREHLLAASDFPLPGDVPALLVINQLIYRGVASPTDLADAVDTGRSNLSKIVDRLTRAGLVVRIANPYDRRSVAIALTSKGRAVASRIIDAAASLNTPAGPDWTAQDTVDLERLLVKLARALDALPNHPLSTAAGVDLEPDH